jgi:predicted MFS family arabinose efflux permease
MSADRPSLLTLPKSETSLNRLFFGDGLTVTTAQLVGIAIPTYALLTAKLDAQYVSLLNIAQWLPPLLLSGVVGRLVHRHRRTALLGLAGAISAGALLGMPATAILESNVAKFAVLLTVAVLFACGELLFSITSVASVPQMVKEVTVAEAISVQTAIRNVSRVVSLGLAGPLTQMVGSVTSLVLAAVVSLTRSYVVSKIENSPTATASPQRTAKPWRVLLESSLQRRLVIATTTINVGSAVILGSFFAFCYEVLAIRPFDVGAVLFVGGCFSVGSAYFAKSLVKKVSLPRLCTGGGVIACAAMWLMPLSAFSSHSVAGLAVYEAIFSSAATVFAIAFGVLRQELVRADMLGQMASMYATLQAVAMICGSVVASWIIASGTVTGSVLFGCGVCALGSLFLLMLPVAPPPIGKRLGAAP